MIGRVLAFAGGVTAAAACSQYPEFSQQYIQRLAGQVDALHGVVSDFDRSASASGLTRLAALEELQGTAFLEARRADMQNAFARFARLSNNLAFLRLASPMERIAMPHRLADPDTFDATWADFRPAMPLTLEGAVAGVVGFVGGWGAVGMGLSLLLWPFRRRRRHSQPATGRNQPS